MILFLVALYNIVIDWQPFIRIFLDLLCYNSCSEPYNSLFLAVRILVMRFHPPMLLLIHLMTGLKLFWNLRWLMSAKGLFIPSIGLYYDCGRLGCNTL
jgi:hypothetical protein